MSGINGGVLMRYVMGCEKSSFRLYFKRFLEHHANYFDIEGNVLLFGEVNYPQKFDKDLKLLSTLHEMITSAEKIAKDQRFVRVDFYDHNGHIYFGEITFYPQSGMGLYEPLIWDYKIGEWFRL